jgi:hypothetical protein
VLAPPRIGFGDPKGVEARIFASLGHGHSFVDGLHAELKNSDVKWNSHSSDLRFQVLGLRKSKVSFMMMPDFPGA